MLNTLSCESGAPAPEADTPSTDSADDESDALSSVSSDTDTDSTLTESGAPAPEADTPSTNSADDESDALSSVSSDTDTDSTLTEPGAPKSPQPPEPVVSNDKLAEEYIWRESQTLLPKVVHACLWRAKKLDIPPAFNPVLSSWLEKSLSQIEVLNDEAYGQVVCISEHLVSFYYIFAQILDEKSKKEFKLLDEKQKCQSLENDLLTSLLLALKTNSDRAYWNSDFMVFYYQSLGKNNYPIDVFIKLQRNMLEAIKSYFAINKKLPTQINPELAKECEIIFGTLLQVFAKPQEYFTPFNMKHAVFLKQKLDKVKILTKAIAKHTSTERSGFDAIQPFTQSVDNTHAFLCRLLTPFREKLKALRTSELTALDTIHWQTSWKATTDLQSFIMTINSESSLYRVIFLLQSQNKEADWLLHYKRVLTRDDACVPNKVTEDCEATTNAESIQRFGR